MRKVVVAMDSFKGSLSSMEAGNTVREGIKKAMDTAEVIVKPIADGGEGTVDALIESMKGKKIEIAVTGPLGDKVNAEYGIIESEKSAIIEMAQAAGLPLIKKEKRNPLNTTTCGVGEMIRDAMDRGCRNFIIGIGGSATNDCGIGMLKALGYEFYDKESNPVSPDGKGLSQIASISSGKADKRLRDCKFRIACDVDNPLYGENGAAFIYGPQKGATNKTAAQLDNGMRHFAEIVKKECKIDASKEKGAGAAGGLGYGFMVFLNGKLESGIDIIMDAVGLADELKDADYFVTGEGRLDAQTAMGKGPGKAARLAKKYGAVTIALAGSIGEGAYRCNTQGIDSFFPIINKIQTLEEAMKPECARYNMKNCAEQVFRLLASADGKK